MDIALRVNIDLFCSQVAVLLLAGLQSKHDRGKLDYRLFMSMLILVCIKLLADTAMLITNGSATTFGQGVLHNAVFVFFALDPFIGMLYAIYVELLTLPLSRRRKKTLLLYYLPAIGTLCLCFVSLFTNWLFSFDNQGYFYAGRLHFVPTMIYYGYLLWALIVAFGRRKTINHREFQALVSFPVPMAICGFLQILLPDYVILLPSFLLSLIVLNANIQERRLMFDYLTGAYNRRRLDEYLEVLIQDSRNSGQRFSAFLADVNDFKLINDHHGHVAGDEALVKVVSLIRASLRIDDFLARYAGDEFVAILPDMSKKELDLVIERIHRNLEKESKSESPYGLSVSIGGAEFDPSFQGDAEDYISHLDTLMYEQKKRHHAQPGLSPSDHPSAS